MKCFERCLYEKIDFVIVLLSVCGYGFPNNVKDHMVGVPLGFCEVQGFWSTECEEIKMAMIIFFDCYKCEVQLLGYTIHGSKLY